VARTLLGLMQAAGGPGEASTRTVAGHWLQGPGRATLLQALGLRVGLAGVAPSLQQSGRMGLYLALLAAGTAWLTLGLTPASGDVWSALAAMLLVAPASEAVLALMHRLVSESTRPRRLPRLALSGGIPAEHRVLVVIPALLGSADGADALVHRLHLHHLANPEAQAQFALLTDGVDAASATLPRDADLLTRVQSGLAALNARHPPGPDTAPRFVLLHRERRWSATERALDRLGTQARQARTTGGCPGHRAQQRVRRPGRVRRNWPAACATSAHARQRHRPAPGSPARTGRRGCTPAEPAALAPDGRRVVSGYGILQPRLVPRRCPSAATARCSTRSLPANAASTPTAPPAPRSTRTCSAKAASAARACSTCRPLHSVLAGAAARRPRAQPRPARRVAGALRRGQRHHAGRGRPVPRRRGSLARAPLDPRRLAVAAGPAAPARWPMRAVNRWKMIDNLRRSLVAPASLALLVLALAGVLPSPADGAGASCWRPSVPAR
jgi:cyclic beta-1,2-glucan synthetase